MIKHHPGMGCHCSAYSENECCCVDADWRSTREVELEDTVEKLKECLSHYAVYQTAYGTKNAAAKLLEELK